MSYQSESASSFWQDQEALASLEPESMTEAEMNVKLCKKLGIEPKRMWRVWYDTERQHGSVQILTKNEAFLRAQHEAERWFEWNPKGSEITISDPEEYDEWCDAPNLFADTPEGLWACHQAEKELTPAQHGTYEQWIIEGENVVSVPHASLRTGALFLLVHATAPQRALALYRTLCE